MLSIGDQNSQAGNRVAMGMWLANLELMHFRFTGPKSNVEQEFINKLPAAVSFLSFFFSFVEFHERPTPMAPMERRSYINSNSASRN